VIVTGVCKLITAVPVPTLVHPLASLTLAIVYVVAAFGITVKVPVVVLNVDCVPSLNVTTNGAVPVIVTLNVADVLAQIVCVPLNTAVGLGLTVTVAVPAVKPVLRMQLLASVTLTNV
jgi:hypothetical protein